MNLLQKRQKQLPSVSDLHYNYVHKLLLKFGVTKSVVLCFEKVIHFAKQMVQMIQFQKGSFLFHSEHSLALRIDQETFIITCNDSECYMNQELKIFRRELMNITDFVTEAMFDPKTGKQQHCENCALTS